MALETSFMLKEKLKMTREKLTQKEKNNFSLFNILVFLLMSPNWGSHHLFHKAFF